MGLLAPKIEENVLVAKIDVCLVTTRRPDLLKATLDSFTARMIGNFEVVDFYANIDPLFGDTDDHRHVVDLIKSYFPFAKITEPSAPNFCAAVRQNWRSTTADHILHLEDDWLLNNVVDQAIFSDFTDPRVMQVAFHSAEKCWDVSRRGKVHYRRKPLKIFGYETPIRIKVPGFTTSPSILKGKFARDVAKLYDVRFDPEKQFYKGLNANLEHYVSGYSSTIFSVNDGFVITDIGREWRDTHGIRKSITDGVPKWA